MRLKMHFLKMSEVIRLTPFEKKLVIPNAATTMYYGLKGLNWKGKIRYRMMVLHSLRMLNSFYKKALDQKVCYYGPFKGEFGHFLLHNLPFLVHLHKRGVKIHYCGMELHKPFLVDESGKSIVHKWYPLPDFFAEAKPMTNSTVLPTRIQAIVNEFIAIAKASGKPFLDISKNNMYWYVFRNWQLDGKQDTFDLSKFYGKSKTNTCVIFPRKKGEAFSPNNGGPWDYEEIARAVSPYFDKVFLVGHPSLSTHVETSGNIEFKVSANNAETLKYCAEAKLIITQHSGAVHLGGYVQTPVLIIFNGSPPIKGLIDTIRFRKNLTSLPLNYALNIEEIKTFARSFSSQSI